VSARGGAVLQSARLRLRQPRPIRQRILRDWLRGNPEERDRYAAAKREAASTANAAGEHVMQYNARKQQVIREIYHRAFVAAGLLDD
jgi:GrpB-like predicted nucleotidyltransferase (UPF0157 family)